VPIADLNVPLVPAFDVIVAGQALPVEALTHVTELSVEESIAWPSMFSFEIEGSDDLRDRFRWIDDEELFALGSPVDVRLGYGDELESIFKGEITGLEPTFDGGRRPGLLVRGYDRRHRLQRGRQTRTFLQQKDSDIASAVATQAGLSAQVTDSAVVHDYVVQAGQTDLEFLQERARRIGFEVVIDDRKLLFRPAANGQGEALTVTPNDHLLEFAPRLSGARQIDSVSLRAWDPAAKEKLVAAASSSDVASTMGGEKSGPQLAGEAFGSADGTLYSFPVGNQAEADQIAKAQLNDLALSLVEGDGTCLGRTDLRAGKVIKIDGVGRRFGGLYYVTDAIHRYTPVEGYRTGFTVRRNAI